MNDIKYLGVQGLEELIILAQNGLAKKADTLQFDVMPDPIKYIGKIVQYVGVSRLMETFLLAISKRQAQLMLGTHSVVHHKAL